MIQREACLGAEVVVVLIQEALLHPAVEAGAEGLISVLIVMIAINM